MKRFEFNEFEIFMMRAANLANGDDIVCAIEKDIANDFISTFHYMQKPRSSSEFVYGVIHKNNLITVITYSNPVFPNLNFICKDNLYAGKYRVLELNRLINIGSGEYPLSKIVALSLKDLSNFGNYVVISFADCSIGHHGYIYQACNFFYTGKSKDESRWIVSGRPELHNRSIKPPGSNGKQIYEGDAKKIIPGKHRYIYFCVKNKKFRKKLIESCKFDFLPYPKGQEQNYTIIDGKPIFRKIYRHGIDTAHN